jgi:hypothetical protein
MGEVLVARSEGSFANNGEGCGKTVDIRQFVFGSQFSRGASQLEISGHDFQRQLCDKSASVMTYIIECTC